MKILFAALFLFTLIPLGHAASEINTTLIGNLAIKGYDPVGYFTDGKPVKGDKAFTHEWKGATWRFASEKNRELFKAEPEKYAPQYGGYCAYAVSQGSTATIDPEQWTLLNGKLYLNYNAKINKQWTEKRDEYITQADQNWPAVLAK